jgi:uroporphyrinogen-III synthase
MKVLITRPRAQSESFADALRVAGFEPIFFPVIEIRPIENNVALVQALNKLNFYEWVVFTSVNAVEVVWNQLVQGESQRASLPRVAAIGPKTAKALQRRGINPDFIPDEYVAESILPGLGDLRDKWVLLPRAEMARKALPEAISKAGGIAHEIAVYQTLPVQPDTHALAALKSGMDWITFTSPSTVQNFVQILHRHKLDPFNLTGNPKVVCIGPVTEQTAREEGFEVDLVAEKYTADGLITVLSNM